MPGSSGNARSDHHTLALVKEWDDWNDPLNPALLYSCKEFDPQPSYVYVPITVTEIGESAFRGITEIFCDGSDWGARFLY